MQLARRTLVVWPCVLTLFLLPLAGWAADAGPTSEVSEASEVWRLDERPYGSQTRGHLASFSGEVNAPATVPSPDPNASPPPKIDDLLNLDLDQLSKVRVSPAPAPKAAGLDALSSTISASGGGGFSEGTTAADLMNKAPEVNTRRLSAINLDPRIRGYQSSQINASAGGITQLKTRVDIDSLFSQIDPGIVNNFTVIDGPYTSLYGPGFAFLTADLLPTPRYAERPETHFSTVFAYGSNGNTLYSRENVISGGEQWGAVVSYGLRVGDDYHPGGAHYSDLVPASYRKWDGLLALGYDLNSYSRIEFNYLRTELNDVELPGVVYDLNHSVNDQFSLRYVVQEDRGEPEQLSLQTWWQQTHYQGDALRASKQRSFYFTFLTLSNADSMLANTVGQGRSDSLGVRLLRTLGDPDGPQATVGVDWRRYIQRYQEIDFGADGEIAFDGDIFGIPRSHMDDVGALAHLSLPISERVFFAAGGRIDAAWASFDRTDPVVTQIADPDSWYFGPGFNQPGYALGMVYATGKMKLNEDYTVNVGSGYAMRPPSLAELYSNDPYVPMIRFGNSYVGGLSTLAPERCWQVDFGLGLKRPRWSWRARGFYATVWDYILPAPAFVDLIVPPGYVDPRVYGRDFRDFPAQWRMDLGTPNENADIANAGYQYVNIDLAALYGGELEMEFQWRDWLTLFGSMGYVNGANLHPVAFDAADTWSSPDGTLVPLGRPEGLPGLYPLSGTAGVALHDRDPERDRWGFAVTSRMVAPQDYVAASLAELRSPGFVVFDLYGYYRFNERIGMTLAVQNLLNRDYTEPGALAMVNLSGVRTFVQEPGTSALLGVDGRF